MAENSKIEWTHHTFNPWRGCTKVSAGCANCYAETLSGRNPGTLGVWGPNGTRVVAAEGQWSQPLKWNKAAKAAGERHRVFCASLADVFEDWRGPMHWSDGKRLWQLYPPSGTWTTATGDHADKAAVTMQDVRMRLFRLIDRTPNLDWLLLTKRPENVSRMVMNHWGFVHPEYPSNVWLGTSVENQQAADERIPHLLRVPAAVRFLSMEPLLGGVDVRRWLYSGHDRAAMDRQYITPLPGTDEAERWYSKVNWVIVGGESGRDARPLHPAWARDLRDQCEEAGTPFFYKQWGEWCPSDIAPKPEPEPTTILKGTPAECVVMQRPKVSFQVVKPDGGDRLFNAAGRFSGEGPMEADCWMHRVGKKAAGRTLDGRTWDEFPEVR